MKNYLFIFFLLVIVSGCRLSDNHKEINTFKNNEWDIENEQVFEFEITDVSSTYHFNYLIRNKINYPFYNLYLQQHLTNSSGANISNSMDEIILFDPKTGKPYGDGSSDIFDIKVGAPKLQNVKFDNPGKYQWIIKHNMRPNPLSGIMAVGVEVIKN